MKLTVVGGGSTYTPELIAGIADAGDWLAVDEVALVDPDIARVGIVGAVAARILSARGHNAKVTWGSDLDAGVDGSAAVLLQLRIGGQEARHGDESWPNECGCIGQETTGAGGLAKAMRTIPVVLDIADRIRQRALDSAWIIDFTNPVGIVTRALLDDGHRAIGLCNVAIGFQRRFAKALGVDPARVALDHVGLNHLTWERAVHVDGTDVLPALLDESADEIGSEMGIPGEFVRRIGVVPSYYLRYFYSHADVLAEQVGGAPTRAQKVMELERHLLSLYADPKWVYDATLLESRGGAFYSDAALRLVASLLADSGDIQVLNVRNNGALPFLSDDAVIEVPSRVGSEGAEAMPISPVNPLFSGLIAHVSAYEELAVDAARLGGRDRVFDALLAHPLIGQVEMADGLADRLVAHNVAHLPWSQDRSRAQAARA